MQLEINISDMLPNEKAVLLISESEQRIPCSRLT